MAKQFDFVQQRVLEMLKGEGYDQLSEDDQKAYLVQFTAEAERRLGLALLPHLTDQAATELEKVTNQDPTPDQWYDFWNKNIPNFVELVNKTLEDFGKEITAAFKM